MGTHFQQRQAEALKDLKKDKQRVADGKKLKKISKVISPKNFDSKYNFVIYTLDEDFNNMIERYLNSVEGVTDRRRTEIKYRKRSLNCIAISNFEFFAWLEKNKSKHPDFQIFYEIQRKGGNNFTGPWIKLNLNFWK